MKICIVRIDKMGDMILTLPIIQGLNKSDNTVDVVCSQRNLKICEKLNIINKIYLLHKNLTKILSTIREIIKKNYDYIFTFSPEMNIFSFSSTLQERFYFTSNIFFNTSYFLFLIARYRYSHEMQRHQLKAPDD